MASLEGRQSRGHDGCLSSRSSLMPNSHGHGGRCCLLMTWLKIVRKDLSRHSLRWLATAGPTP
jgi:hypothetical protein